MSRQPENTFISSVHKYLPKEIYHQKNHNQYNGGIPDCWYSGETGDLWVEYKFVVLPKRADTMIRVDLSELQKNWLASRHSEGRQVAVIVGCKDGGLWLPGLGWHFQYSAEAFRRNMVSRLALAAAIAKLTHV